ncbi:hypothetical protein DV515_00017993 [Chloebia gouldiae]|uniref:Uncharacterized protein n=1 Tax=Chloebia gouldiae TaxID=44316 RepID=A0A3L8Q904_CHLGU|nr:hypothetical protein DV515_00017993 [Chloebia gouldiae]
MHEGPVLSDGAIPPVHKFPFPKASSHSFVLLPIPIQMPRIPGCRDVPAGGFFQPGEQSGVGETKNQPVEDSRRNPQKET